MNNDWMSDESDPSKPSTDYVPFPAGEHRVSGIFKFGTVDDKTGEPFYKQTAGRPAVRVILRLADGNEGPPMTCDPAQLMGLVLGFQGDAGVAAMGQLDPLTLAFLLRAKGIINGELDDFRNAPPTRKAFVNDKGWVTSVEGARPEGMFQWEFIGARNLDGSTPSVADLKFQPDNYNKNMMLFQFKIAGNIFGHPSPFNGWVEQVRVEQPFDGVKTRPDGRQVPNGRITAAGGRPKAVARIQQFVDVFCFMNGYEWQSDPTKSALGINEAANPIPVIVSQALAARRRGVAAYSKGEKSGRLFLDLESFQAVPQAPEGIPTQQTSAPAAGQSNLVALRAWIDDKCRLAHGVSAFVDSETLALSDEGKNFCKNVLMGDWERLGLPSSKRIADLSEDQAGQLLSALSFTGPAPSPDEGF